MQIPFKKIEIFCGTGGVGKTTLATSRALNLAFQKKKVLLITIDPARRLKEILKMHEADSGKITTISPHLFTDFNDQTFTFDALLMSPEKTLTHMAKESDTEEEFENPILKTLSRPHGGMNEILAMIEVQKYFKSNKYDSIIVDTPPGKHFIDFLESCNKIQHFFHKSYLEIFKFLGKSTGTKNDKKFLSMLVSSGIKKLLKYLEKVTGALFVEHFINAVVTIYKNKQSFLDAIAFQETLRNPNYSNWFLVTSVEQQKTKEATNLQAKAVELMHQDNFLIVNKCLSFHLDKWKPTLHNEQNLKSYFLKRETEIRDFATKEFGKILFFPDILSESPADHVNSLGGYWEQTELHHHDKI